MLVLVKHLYTLVLSYTSCIIESSRARIANIQLAARQVYDKIFRKRQS
jgi:hypothetical protein